MWRNESTIRSSTGIGGWINFWTNSNRFEKYTCLATASNNTLSSMMEFRILNWKPDCFIHKLIWIIYKSRQLVRFKEAVIELQSSWCLTERQGIFYHASHRCADWRLHVGAVQGAVGLRRQSRIKKKRPNEFRFRAYSVQIGLYVLEVRFVDCVELAVVLHLGRVVRLVHYFNDLTNLFAKQVAQLFPQHLTLFAHKIRHKLMSNRRAGMSAEPLKYRFHWTTAWGLFWSSIFPMVCFRTESWAASCASSW